MTDELNALRAEVAKAQQYELDQRAEVERLRHNLETETGEHTKTVAELENVEWMLEQDRAELAKANTRVAELEAALEWLDGPIAAEREACANAEVTRLKALRIDSEKELRAEMVRIQNLPAIREIIGVEDKFRARIAELEEALDKIAALVDSETGEPLDDAITIARAALERKS